MRSTLAALLIGCLSLGSHAATPTTPTSPDETAQALFARCYHETSAYSPMELSWNGDYSRNDQLDDLSDATAAALLEVNQRCLKEALAIDAGTLSGPVRESMEVFAYTARRAIEGYAFRDFDYPSNPMGGWDSGVFGLLTNAHPIRNEKDARAYLARVAQIPRFLVQVRERTAASARAGVVLPRPLFAAVYANFAPLQRGKPMTAQGQHPLAQDFARKLAALKLPAKESSALRRQLDTLLRSRIQPALRVHLAALHALEKKAPAQGGLSRIPGGAEAYAFALRTNTTTDLSPEDIHRLGLQVMAELTLQMQSALRAAGLKGELASDYAHLRSDPQYYFANTDAGRAQLITEAKHYVDQARRALPQLFTRLPKADVNVKRMDLFAEAGDAAARYQSPAVDGSQPGQYVLNLANTRRIPRYALEVLSYHEAIPGHHMQTAIAQENGALPLFRQRQWYVAYGEGWALYSEQLGKELGFYSTPLSEVGRLADSMWRAARLVVDTGLHAKGWSRQQARDYMSAAVPSDPDEVNAEIDRYLVWPGQATGYMVGKLRLVALREKAQAALKDKFDVRRFHDTVLAAGAVPLTVLDSIIDRWIAKEQQAGG